MCHRIDTGGRKRNVLSNQHPRPMPSFFGFVLFLFLSFSRSSLSGFRHRFALAFCRDFHILPFPEHRLFLNGIGSRVPEIRASKHFRTWHELFVWLGIGLGKGAGVLEKLPFPANKRSVSNGLSEGRKSLKKAKAKTSPGRRQRKESWERKGERREKKQSAKKRGSCSSLSLVLPFPEIHHQFASPALSFSFPFGI